MHAEQHGPPRPHLAVLVPIAASALVLAGCGGHDRSRVVVAPPVTTVATAPVQVVPESTWHRGRVRIDYADGLAVVGDSVYVKTDDGHVVRVGATSHAVRADVRVDTTEHPDEYCQGIGTDGRTLWACSASSDGTTHVVRLDPQSLKVLATVPVDKVFDQFTLSLSAGTLWVLSGTGQILTAVDATSNRTTSYPLGQRCLQAAATVRYVYLTCLLSDRVLAVDTSTGKVVYEATLKGPVNVVADDVAVWVSGAEGIVRFSRSLQRRSVYPRLVAGRDGDLMLTEGALWVRQGPEFLSRIDRRTGTVAARYAIDPVPSGGSLASTGDRIWTSAYNDNVVIVVDATR